MGPTGPPGPAANVNASLIRGKPAVPCRRLNIDSYPFRSPGFSDP